MKKYCLSNLKKIDLRAIWISEAQDFTPWLAQEDNLALLGKIVDMDLKLEVCEKDVGPFRADILCKDLNTDRWVLIENQLEVTDHKHLGQVLTYASGLKALAIIWIAGNFTEEHRSTLDWLNEITDERFHFFGLEIELWCIGESLPAPKFNLIAKPNNWSQQVASAANKISFEDLTETKKLQLDYWQKLSHYLHDKESTIRPQKAKPQHWMNFAIGRSGIHLSASVNSQKKSIAVELYLRDINAKIFFNSLHNQKHEIEKELGQALEWMELPEKTASRIILSTRSANFLKKEEWDRQHEWLKHYLEKFWLVFNHRVKRL